MLTRDFDRFFFPSKAPDLRAQLDWLRGELSAVEGKRVFTFLNIGETHVPYHFAGADWDASENPCRPFKTERNDAGKCRTRQRTCVEFADRMLAPLLEAFRAGTTLICADHGDCWGEDGLWEHGIHHEKTLEVPLLYRLGGAPGKPAGNGQDLVGRGPN